MDNVNDNDHVYEVYFKFFDEEYGYNRSDLRLIGGYKNNDSHSQAESDMVKILTKEGKKKITIMRVAYL